MTIRNMKMNDCNISIDIKHFEYKNKDLLCKYNTNTRHLLVFD